MIKKIIITLLCLLPALTLSADKKNFVEFAIAKNHFKKGVNYFNRMDYLASVEFFRKAIEQYPDYLTARDYLARAYRLSGFLDESLIELENILTIYPDNVRIKTKIEDIKYTGSFTPENIIDQIIYYNSYESRKFGRFSFSKPIDIAVDEEKNLYITSFSSGKLVKINPEGEGVFAITPAFNGKLYGIDYYDNKIVVSAFSEDMVYILNKKGDILNKFGRTGRGNGEFHGPEGVCFDSSGNIYVVDSGNFRVQKFNAKGDFILKFGSEGDLHGEFGNPSDLVVLNDLIYVTDTKNKKVSCFDDSGNYIFDITDGKFKAPRGITKTDNTIMVSDEKNGLFSYNVKNNKTIWLNYHGDDKKKFSKLFSSVIDRDGYLYCLDYNYEAVFNYSPIRKIYSNLDVEITSVDLNKFPIVAFYLNVKSRDGKSLYNLSDSNFKITEDRAPIDGVYSNYLKKLTPSISLILCVDRSNENKKYKKEVPWVSDFILKKMKRNDFVKIIDFNDKLIERNKFDWSRRRSLRALKSGSYGSGKRIGKALYNSLNDLISRLNRRAIVFITDGKVTEKSFLQYTPEIIIQYAKAHYIPISMISFNKIDPTLKRIAIETGGDVYQPHEIDELEKIYRRIKKSEEYRYVLVYETHKLPEFKGWWSDVKIDVNYRGEKGTEWGGYFVP